MASDPVTVILGVGKVTAESLKIFNITTVEQLANVKPGEISVPNLGNLCKLAKAYLEKKTGGETITLNGSNCKKEQATENELSRYLITDHTWYDRVVRVPHPESIPNETKYQQAIVYEILVDPNQRVSLNCEWLENETECNFSYSPVLIRHCNPELPELCCDISLQDKQIIPFHALVNALWESNQIHY